MSRPDNEREFTRVSTPLQVTVETPRLSWQSGRSRDLSMNGLSLVCSQRLPVGTECRVVIRLEGAEPPVEVKARASVVRENQDGLALEFQELDLDSFNHLRNLVLLNSRDQDEQVEQELLAHVGLKKRRTEEGGTS